MGSHSLRLFAPICAFSRPPTKPDEPNFTNKNNGINKSAKTGEARNKQKVSFAVAQKKRRMLLASAFLTASENVSWLS
jgi:hypothetical protein